LAALGTASGATGLGADGAAVGTTGLGAIAVTAGATTAAVGFDAGGGAGLTSGARGDTAFAFDSARCAAI
jgi:hypothetical protein